MFGSFMASALDTRNVTGLYRLDPKLKPYPSLLDDPRPQSPTPSVLDPEFNRL